MFNNRHYTNYETIFKTKLSLFKYFINFHNATKTKTFGCMC